MKEKGKDYIGMRRAQLIVLALLLVLTACGGDEESSEGRTRIITATPAAPSTASVPLNFTTPTQSFSNPTANVGGSLTTCAIPPGWQAYQVQANDTLSSIASAIGSNPATIQTNNCLSNDVIYVGQTLYLPSLPLGVPTVAPTVASVGVPDASGSTTNCPSPPASWVAYIIQFGDTLGTLAEQTGTTYTQLQSVNCLANADNIMVGQRLWLPSSPGSTAIIQPTFTPATGSCNIPVGWQPYTIVPGDTLGVLAQRYNTTTAVIQSSNCLPNADTIYVGQTIYLPPVGVTLPTLTPTFILAPTITPAAQDTGTPPRLSQASPMVRPTQNRTDGALVTLQQTVSLDIGVVPDANRVVYWAMPATGDPTPIQVGVDNDPYNGTSVSYTFNPFDSELYFYAVAENEYGSTASFMVRVVYDPTFVVGAGKPDIFPFIGFDASIYTLEPGRTVTVSWRDVPNDAVRVEFYLVQNGINELIGTDSDTSNGIRTLWRVPEPLNGQVFARAVFANGASQDSQSVNVFAQAGN